MKVQNILYKLAISVAAFIGLYYLFLQVNWIKELKIEEASSKTEEKLGELFWNMVSATEIPLDIDIANQAMDSMVTKLCSANQIDRSTIKLHILRKKDVNAFAMPDGHLVVYSGLIEGIENQDAVVGVLAHEIAHIRQHHVMQKLKKELGIGVLISISGSGAGGEMVRKALRSLTSSAFDREMEKEADRLAVKYLLNANVDPAPLAAFFQKLSKNEVGFSNYLDWISTHPDSQERANTIFKTMKGKRQNFTSVLHSSTWATLKTLIVD